MTNVNYKILYCVLGCMIGPALGGYFIGRAIEHFKSNDRVVIVKGLSEKEVKSDLAIWTINYKNSENDLSLLDKKMALDKEALETFLLQAGFNKDEISAGCTEIVDKASREYSSSGDDRTARYIMTGKTTLRTAQVDSVLPAQEKISQLIQRGVIVSGSPSFYYTKLLDVRPQMIAEATKNARHSATQFADDSGCKVGSIRTANQGVFSISAKDSLISDSNYSDLSSIDKKIRVVSTITFSLEQ